MAVVEPIQKPIKAHQYVTDSIAYVLSPENRNGDEKCFKATCLNCANGGAEDLAKQFYEIRRAYNKDSERLAHHYVQSFSPNENITPELAHKLGVELAEKIAPEYQVIVSTHIDKDHIHNHIIINSVNPATGLKWVNNKSSLRSIWQENDKLCKQYGLTTIDKQSGLSGIDQATQKLAEKGKSWKVDLCHALDEAVKICNTKDEFISFMKSKSFLITRYTDRHITFQKVGETKTIRADTLAKQFGDKYKKIILERLMGFYTPPKKAETVTPTKKKKTVPSFKTEFEKYEEKYFRDNPSPVDIATAKKYQVRIKKSKFPLFMLLVSIIKMFLKKRKGLDRKYTRLHFKLKKQKQYKLKKHSISEAIKRYENNPVSAGNIIYRDLVKAQGDNYRVRIGLSAIPKLYAYPFFFSAKLYNDHAMVTIKAKDKMLLQKALEVEDIEVLEKHNNYYTAKSEYADLKKRAEQFGVKPEFLVIRSDLLKKLDDEKERFVAFPTDSKKIKIAFLPQNKDYILHALYPDKYAAKDDLFSVSRNSKVNTRLKSEALLGGKQIRYRILSKEEVEHLAESVGDDRFAVFSKNSKGESLNGQYNVVFKEDDTEDIETALKNPKTTKRKI